MKWLIFICLVIVSAAAASTEPPTLLGDRQINFHENGSVSLHGTNGNQFTISHYPEQHYYDILLHGYEIIPKHVHIDSENCQITHLEGFKPIHQQYKEKTVDQSRNHLFEILKKFEGKVNDEDYKELLQKIEKGVENGKICHLVYYLLTKLDQVIREDLVEEYVKQYHYKPEPEQPTYPKEDQKLYKLLIEYILKNKYEFGYPKYGYQQYPYQYQQYPYQYQEYPQQYQQYPYQYPQQYQQYPEQYQQYPYQYQQEYQPQYYPQQYQQQYPQYYPQQYQQQYPQYYPQQNQQGYYPNAGGEKTYLRNYVFDTTAPNGLQTTTPKQGYGNAYGYGPNQHYGTVY